MGSGAGELVEWPLALLTGECEECNNYYNEGTSNGDTGNGAGGKRGPC